jgi:hypothetical protein
MSIETSEVRIMVKKAFGKYVESSVYELTSLAPHTTTGSFTHSVKYLFCSTRNASLSRDYV